jgi:hypothetical protein
VANISAKAVSLTSTSQGYFSAPQRTELLCGAT